MRKLSRDKKEYEIRRNLRLRRRIKKSKKYSSNSVKKRFPTHIQIAAPYSFDISKEKPRSQLLTFINQLRYTVLVKEKCACINFSNTQKLDAGGTLLFVAELSRIQYLSKRYEKQITIRCVPAAKRKVSQVLSRIGVYKRLRTPIKIGASLDEDVVHWRFATGRGAVGEKYDEILGRYDGSIAPTLSHKLYVGLTEAMSNVHYHAHIEPRNDGLNIQLEDDTKDWWMFSQERDGILLVVFCDLGIGIPGSLPKQHPTLWQSLLSLIGQNPLSDGHVIKEATQVSVSRTGASHRGRGLRQMVTAITGEFKGKVRIFSNKGLYTYDGQNELVDNFSTSILGTIIAWATPLGKDRDEGHHEQHYHQYR
ncbi:hypothetical protein [Methylococcus mesophilus]|uniref:hypothetical protein n=1 Tax=Methylococcus mesophilus TaxID=2993564 RepID=UPI00224AE78B|nr:hypothetical protein [Methylococcus mesophilus]UZR29054.1 hypothetical protein OOT43_00075 [Methylococcus mesophilus]